MSLVSVVIPSHRGDRYLPEALASVLTQSHGTWEVLVVDDHPAAPAADVVRRFARTVGSRRVEYLHGRAGGPGSSRNLGIRAARGSHLAFLDEDDIWETRHLEAALSSLTQSGADLAFSTVDMFDDTTKRLVGVWGPTPAELDDFPVGLYLRNYVAVLSVVMCRRVVDHHGLFDPDPRFRYGEDHDYWVRLAFAGVRFVHVAGIQGRYRKGHVSGTSDESALREVHSRVHRRHLAEALARSTNPGCVRETVARRHAELALGLLRRHRFRALGHAFWALRISSEPGRLLRSGARRILAASITGR